MNLPLTQYGGLLGAYLKPQRSRVVLLAGLLLGGIGLQLLNPQIIRYFIDTAQSSGAQSALLAAALIFFAVGLAQRAAALAAVYLGERVGWTATNALRADLARHCLRLDMSFHKQRTPGELIERIDGDVTALANFFAQLVVRVAGNALLILAVLLLLLREDWRVGLGLAAYTGVTLLALGALQRLGVTRWEAERQASAEQYGFLEERMAGVEDIRAAGAEAHVLGRLYALMRDLLEKYRAARLVSNLTYISANFLVVVGYALGLALGAYLYTRGEVSLGTAYLIVAYIGMLAGPLESIREQIQDLQRASASIERVEELFHIQPRVRENPRATLPDGPLAVAFDGVSFGYNDSGTRNEERGTRNGAAASGESSFIAHRSSFDLVLHDVSFDLAPGHVLGLLGRTGSGKTTLTRLLFRLYDPVAGAIRLDHTDIRDVAFADLRAHVAVVTQDVQLFQASIRDNLTFFNTRIGDDLLAAALRELGLWEWVQARGGLDARLAAGGQGLSAGEAQLLAFARVFLKNPGLVILDEASSRLDPATERLLEQAMGRLLHGRSAIIIAHHLGTVQRADEIMILDSGRIAEHGPREQLAADSGSRFYRLLQTGIEEALA
ncbi:MAG: ABC transporter ATP-binding protein [Roseiflexaceae bacterium]